MLKNNKYPVYIVQGAQWGSEGKGQITAILAGKYRAAAVVRTGSVNAGHTVYWRGQPFKMQLIPTGWVHPHCELHLGPGCYIHRDILAREVSMIKAATGEDIRHRLRIDYRASIHDPECEKASTESGRHHEMGATGKGSSEAVIQRMLARGDIEGAANENIFARNPIADGINFSKCLVDSPERLLNSCLPYEPIVLEGTQGAHLDLYLGPYPYTTNRPVTTAAWLSYAGLPPTLDIRPIMVARTFPIRVAGNSGPMPDECSWGRLYANIHQYHVVNEKIPSVRMAIMEKWERKMRALLAKAHVIHAQWEATEAEQFEHRVAYSECPTEAFLSMTDEEQQELALFIEMTTVTKKIRRVSNYHREMVQEAINTNGCYAIWFTFLNYLFPDTWGRTHDADLGKDAMHWMIAEASNLNTRLGGCSTGPLPEHHIHL